MREGLPSAVGESLLKSADYEIYVRDRSPQAHFAGKAYVLPRQGQLGAPLTTVNTDKVVDRRLSHRRPQSARARPRATISSSRSPPSRASEIETQDGAKVWSGTMDVASELNKDVVTDFPDRSTRSASCEPGVYLVTARPWKARTRRRRADDDSDDAQLATQWMVVSDLGLTTFSGDDGVHALGALARHRRAARRRRGAAGRAQQRSAGDEVDRRGRARRFRSRPVARNRRLGARPAGRDARRRLRLPQSRRSRAFDLTDRGVGGRDAPSALDAFVYTERGVYRSGETVFVTALLRDAKGEAKTGLPLTLVVKRPDGVEYKRVSVADQGLGGRALARAAALRRRRRQHGRSTPTPIRRRRASATPSSCSKTMCPSGSTSRCKLGARPVATPGEPIDLSLDARFLYGAPAAGLDVTGADAPRRRSRALRSPAIPASSAA